MTKNKLLSAVVGTLLSVVPVSADVIGMCTALPLGNKLVLSINKGTPTLVEWGDGSVENISFGSSKVELMVKHANLKITSEQKITQLYCPDCALTSLSLNEAPALTAIDCSDNQLQEIDISRQKNLEQLNCSGNQLKTLMLSQCTELTLLDVSDNQFAELTGLESLPQLQTLLCTGNQLSTLDLRAQEKLKVLWCQGNKMESIGFSPEARPTQICAFNNQLGELTSCKWEQLRELWVDNNQLVQLNLSVAPLEVLSASNNHLNLIELSQIENNQSKLRAFYVDGNQLMINSFPNLYASSRIADVYVYNVGHQRPYVLKNKLEVNDSLVLGSLVEKNAWGQDAAPVVVWKSGDGVVLQKGVDYSNEGNTYVFLKPVKSAVGEVTSPLYPQHTFFFAKMEVVPPTGIGDVAADSVRIQVQGHTVVATAQTAVVVRIYDARGAIVVNETVEAGVHSWYLPTGLYVVNGAKYVLGK